MVSEPDVLPRILAEWCARDRPFTTWEDEASEFRHALAEAGWVICREDPFENSGGEEWAAEMRAMISAGVPPE